MKPDHALIVMIAATVIIITGCAEKAGEVEIDLPDISTEPASDMKAFNDCLAEQGMKIYGADWCPHCKTVVATLGGYDAVSSVYVECTEQQARCQSEMVGTGVPEIQFNGNVYRGARTIEAFSDLTGCALQI